MDHQDPHPEEGNTLILSIVLSAVAIALVLTLGAITQIHIERKQLLALTDTAALHAASAIDEQVYYSRPGADIPLTDASVRRGVEEFIGNMPTPHRERFHSLQVADPTGAAGPTTAEVTLGAYVRPGYIPWTVAPFEGFYIYTTSSATTE